MRDPLWVFAYGSLLWDPGFEVVEQVQGRLVGYQRSFCMRSIHHRGTEENPGLVLALDQATEGVCDGLVLRAQKAAPTLDYLRERELISSAYLETWQQVSLTDGRQIEAVCYVIDPDHRQYCQLDLETQALIIAQAKGGRGPNREYLFNTVDRLEALRLPDDDLTWLADRVRSLGA